jgi:DNA-directed RNA polymerase specialized sigma24 family protein
MHRYFTLISSRLRRSAPAHSRQDAKFIRQLCSGKPAAWVQLIDLWGPRLYSYIFYNTATDADAQTLMRFVMAEVVQTLVGSLRAADLTILIFSIAHHHVLHYRQRNGDLISQRQRLSGRRYPFGSSPEPQFLYLFRQLTLETQQILLLHYLCEVSLPDLAQIIGQSEERLKSTLYRARLSLH